jgi:hypothetical protein
MVILCWLKDFDFSLVDSHHTVTHNTTHKAAFLTFRGPGNMNFCDIKLRI